jgi:hypothetical protein
MSALSEINQIADYKPDLHRNKVKKKRRWQPFGKAGFLKDFIESKTHLILRLRNRDGEELIAYVQRDWDTGWALGDSVAAVPGLTQRFHLKWRKAPSRVYKAHGQEQAMLVKVVETVELPEIEIPSPGMAGTPGEFHVQAAQGRV